MENALNRRDVLKMGLKGVAATAFFPIESMGRAAHGTSNITQPAYIKNISQNGKVVVVGAGAFGGWTALHLLRKGYQVTLIDQFGPGNNQSSSGGETRLIRAFYGDRKIYFDLTLRALDLWKENQPKMTTKILHQNGLAVFVTANKDSAVEAAIPMYANAGLVFEKLSASEAAKRWPGISFSDVDHVMFDPVAGFIESRRACAEVRDLFVKEGGKFIQDQVLKENIKSGKNSSVTLSNGASLEADAFVFACGPWLVRLFPLLTQKLKVTRQVCFFFASPQNASDMMENKLPTWFNKTPEGKVDVYGVPGNEYRGFKIAAELTDNITDKFDSYHRYYTPEELDFAEQKLALRFPAMKGRPMIESRVCQYTETPDAHFILDKHPEADNVFIMGGGSGHGYKMGPSMGELAAQLVAGEKKPTDTFSLDRLLKP
jgi:glycine/D-amino acid oxidase-like deaminating enzyme